MASAVHIPESVVSDINPLLDMAKEGTVTIKRGGESFQLVRTTVRPLSEILADPTIQWSNAVPDDQWGRDLEEIIASRKVTGYDPWAE